MTTEELRTKTNDELLQFAEQLVEQNKYLKIRVDELSWFEKGYKKLEFEHAKLQKANKRLTKAIKLITNGVELDNLNNSLFDDNERLKEDNEKEAALYAKELAEEKRKLKIANERSEEQNKEFDVLKERVRELTKENAYIKFLDSYKAGKPIYIHNDSKTNITRELIKNGTLKSKEEFETFCEAYKISHDECGKYQRIEFGLAPRLSNTDKYHIHAYYIARGIVSRGDGFKPIDQLITEYNGFIPTKERFFVDMLNEEIDKQK